MAISLVLLILWLSGDSVDPRIAAMARSALCQLYRDAPIRKGCEVGIDTTVLNLADRSPGRRRGRSVGSPMTHAQRRGRWSSAPTAGARKSSREW